MRKLIDQVKNFGKSLNENVGDITYSIYLENKVIYTHLPNERLKSILFSLQNELGEDLEDYIVLQNGTNNTKPANELGWDLSNVKPFDNTQSLKSKIEAISNGI